MANITTNDNIVDKNGRTKALNNDFWRAFVSNIPTGTATLSPDGVSDTTKYLQHLNGIFVGETDGTVYLGHGLKGNVNNAFNGINCGTLATGINNYSSSGNNNLSFLTSGIENAVGAGRGNLYFLTTGNNNAVGSGSNNLQKNTSGNGNAVGSGFENLFNTTSSFNIVGAGIRNLYFNTTGQYNSVGAGYENFYRNTTGQFNSAGAGYSIFGAANHSHLTGEGYRAGNNLIGNNNTSIGSLSNFFSGDIGVASKTYTVATNKTITSTAHGFTIGSLIGFGGLGSIANTTLPFYFKVIDADTIETYPNTLTNLTVGQTFTGNTAYAALIDLTNATALGYATKNTKSNQVALGDSNVAELLLGGTLAIDKASLVGAADGTPIVIRTIGGVKTITV